MQTNSAKIQFDSQFHRMVRCLKPVKERLIMRVFAAITLLAVFPSFAEEKLEPVKFDFNQKGTAPQRVVLPIKLASSEELDSLRLDLTLNGVEAKQTEGQAGLLSGKLSTYRFDDTVDVEIRLGRDDGKPMLLIKAYAISKTDKGKEKRTPVSIGGLEAAVAKNSKLTDSLKAEIKKREDGLAESHREEKQLDSDLSPALTAALETQNPQEKAALMAEYNRMLVRINQIRTSIFSQRKSLTAAKHRNMPLTPQIESDSKALAVLKNIQSKCTIHYKASARVGSDITVVAETR